MTVSNKNIKDWERILLDTTVLCDLFLSVHPDTTDERCLFASKLIEYLGKHRTTDGNGRIFYVTSVTVSELLTSEHDSEKIRRILRVLNSKNVEFIDFDLQVALEFNHRLQDRLQRGKLHEMAARIGFKTNDFMMAREWISRDYMILMCGVNKNVDVVLTSDFKSFYPIAKEVNEFPCCLVYPELFEQSEQFILRYLEEDVQSFLNARKYKPAKIASDGQEGTEKAEVKEEK